MLSSGCRAAQARRMYQTASTSCLPSESVRVCVCARLSSNYPHWAFLPLTHCQRLLLVRVKQYNTSRSHKFNVHSCSCFLFFFYLLAERARYRCADLIRNSVAEAKTGLSQSSFCSPFESNKTWICRQYPSERRACIPPGDTG